MAYTTCPLCDSDCPHVAYQVEDWLYALNGSFHIVRCGRCEMAAGKGARTRTVLARASSTDP